MSILVQDYHQGRLLRKNWTKLFPTVYTAQPHPSNHLPKSFTHRTKVGQFSQMSFVDYAPKPSGIPGILLQRTGPAHLSVVQDLLRESFFQNEPLVAALGGPPDRAFMDNEAKLILQQLSLVAVEAASGRILAAVVNRKVTPCDMMEWPSEIDQITCPRSRRLAHFWYSISVDPDIFATYMPPTYVEITFLATSSFARGRGLASLLLRESLTLAREIQTPLVVTYCTNTASARLMEKLPGMKRIGGKRVEEYFEGEKDRREIREKLAPSHHEIRLYGISFDERITL